MKKIYLAAPLFSVLERDYNKRLAKKIGENPDFIVFLPQEISPDKSNKIDPMFPIYEGCRDLIVDSDIILAIVDGSDVDSGVAWELGYATAKGIPSICVRTDIRKSEGNGVNVMIEFSSKSMMYLTKYHQDEKDVTKCIIKELENVLYGKENINVDND